MAQRKNTKTAASKSSRKKNARKNFDREALEQQLLIEYNAEAEEAEEDVEEEQKQEESSEEYDQEDEQEEEETEEEENSEETEDNSDELDENNDDDPNEAVRAYLDEDEAPDNKRKIVLFLFAAVALSVSAFLGYAWYSDKVAITNAAQGEIPLLKADKTPIKEAPSEEENVTVPDLDKRVYDAINPGAKQVNAKAERILPKPEEPIDLAQIGKQKTEKNNDQPTAETETISNDSAEENALTEEEKNIVIPDENSSLVEKSTDKNAAENAENISSAAENTEKTTAEEPEKTAEKTAEKNAEISDEDQLTALAEKVSSANETEKSQPKPQLRPGKKAPESSKNESSKIKDNKETEVSLKTKNAQPKNLDKAADAGQKLKAKNNASSAARIQLGAFKTKEEALSEWKKIKAKHADATKNLEAITERADLGEKGIFYRLQAGNLANENEGRTVCKKLIAQSQGCFLVSTHN
jgi:hypothetical protein